jgi:putative MATE family efflux protein
MIRRIGILLFTTLPCLAFLPVSHRLTTVPQQRLPLPLKSTNDLTTTTPPDNNSDFGVGEKTTAAKSLLTPPLKTDALSPSAILRFVAPTLALWIAPPVMSLIDTAVVGRYCGATELAALGPGCTLIDSSAYLFMFIATASTNLVATAKADGTNADQTVSEALTLALVSGIALGVLVLWAGKPILHAIAGQASANVVPYSFQYAAVRAVGQPAVIMASVARAAALATQDTRGPFLSVALAFGLNAVGTLCLVRIFNMGVVGAAVGTLVADCAAAVFLLLRRKSTTPLFLVPTYASLKSFLRYAAPIFFTILGKSVVYNGVSVAVGRLGSIALAAHEVLLRNFFFWTPVGDSMGMTSQVFLPAILADEARTGVPKQGAKRNLYGIGLVAGMGAAALAGLLPTKGRFLFTTDASVAALLQQVGPFLSASVLLHAIALTCEGMLLAQRDLQFLSNSYVVTTIVTAGFLTSPYRPSTLNGFWWVLTLFQGGRALQFSLRNLWLSRRKRRGVRDSPLPSSIVTTPS